MSVKKEASGRSSVKVEVEAAGNTQSAAERRAAEAELSSLVEKYAPEHQRLVAAMRRSLQKRLPTAHEVVYEYATKALWSSATHRTSMGTMASLQSARVRTA